MRRQACALLVGGVMVGASMLLSGCGGEGSLEDSLWGQIDQLDSEKTELRGEVQRLSQENEQLRERVQTLSQVDAEQREQVLKGLREIEIGRRSGLYDKDEDGSRETLVVYVIPTDAEGDVIKAPGQARVQLWDLSGEAEGAKLGEWTVSAEQMQESWASTFMTNYYRLDFAAPDGALAAEEPLTVKVEFIDYYSGRAFRTQTAIDSDS